MYMEIEENTDNEEDKMQEKMKKTNEENKTNN